MVYNYKYILVFLCIPFANTFFSDKRQWSQKLKKLILTHVKRSAHGLAHNI